MTFLMVNLEDPADCRRGLQQLRGRLKRAGFAETEIEASATRGVACKTADDDVAKNNPAALPLKQKLKRVSQRGVWRFVVGIANLDNQPRSLPELDDALELPRNKMRSTKAIFAKLENRLDVRFLKPAPDASEDAAGNPRYIMPPRVRKAVLELAL